MHEITLDEIQKKFDSLPESLRLAIIVAGADKKINYIGREHGLNVNQISELLLKTHIMMFGFIHPDSFENSIKEISNIPSKVVHGIIKDINEQIIKDMRDDLVALAEKPEKAEKINELEEKEIKTEDEKNDNILKSAGINIITSSIKKEKIIQDEINNIISNKDNVSQNKIENIKIIKPVELIEINKKIEKEKLPIVGKPLELEKEKEPQKIPTLIEPIEIKENRKNEELSTPVEFIELKKIEDFKEISTQDKPIEITESEKNVEISAPSEPIEIKNNEKNIEISTSLNTLAIEKELSTAVEAPILEKTKEVVTPRTQDNEKEKKEESFDESKHIPEKITKEENLNKNLKIAVENIINSYENKDEKEEFNKKNVVQYSIKSSQKEEKEEPKKYINPEEEKHTIILEIIEVQNKMKIMKDRITEIEKEKIKIEKEQSSENDIDNSSKNPELSELYLEEKTIQKIRESELPKEYLSLLEKLDNLTNHNKNINPPLN